MFDLIRRKRFSVKIVFATFPCSGEGVGSFPLALLCAKCEHRVRNEPAGFPKERQLALAVPQCSRSGRRKALRRIGAFPYEGKVVLCFSGKNKEPDEVEARGSAGEKANPPNPPGKKRLLPSHRDAGSCHVPAADPQAPPHAKRASASKCGCPCICIQIVSVALKNA